MSVAAEKSCSINNIFFSSNFSYRDLTLPYLNANRPWFTLYNNKLKWVPKENTKKSLIQKIIPDELMLILFKHLDPYSLAKASCVCHQWRIIAEYPLLWQNACKEAFSMCSDEENENILKLKYSSSWKRMFIERPHLRFDGIYVARNTYLKRGVVEWQNRKPVHIVTYYRYIRFMPNGEIYYYTTPMIPAKVGSILKENDLFHKSRLKSHQGIQKGTWSFHHNGTIVCILKFTSCNISTEVKLVLQLNTKSPGAYNRLNVSVILTKDEGIRNYIITMPNSYQNGDVQQHERGNAPFIFIIWDNLDNTYLNEKIT